MDPVPGRSKWRRRALEGPASLALACFLSFIVLRHMAHGDTLRHIGAEQVGVRVDHRAHTLAPLTAPGDVLFLPWLQEVYLLDRRPREYVMAGDTSALPDQVPRLLVRARDGSSLGFDRVVVQYALDASRADEVLVDSGPGAEFADKVDLYTRSMLRRAIGRHTVQELLQPDVRLAATEEAKNLLTIALAEHGIVVLELTLSKPRFSEAFEKTITRRQVADQDSAALARQALDLETTREARLAKIEREMERSLAKIERQADQNLAAARRAATRKRSDATVAAAQLIEQGRLVELERTEEAARLEALYIAEAEVMRDRMLALAAQGPQSVRAALIERLSSIEFELKPWSSDGEGGRAQSAFRRTSQ